MANPVTNPSQHNSAIDPYIFLPNGKRRIYTIYEKKSDGSQVKVTNNHQNWKTVAQIAANCFCKESGKQVFESAEISASINIKDFETKTQILESDVQLIKAVYKERSWSKTTEYNSRNPNASFSSQSKNPRPDVGISNPFVQQPLLKKIEAGGGGRCLDLSIFVGYQISKQRKKHKAKDPTNPGAKLAFADKLREHVSKEMQNNSSFDTNEEFRNALRDSIQSILEEAKKNTSTSTAVRSIISEMAKDKANENSLYERLLQEYKNLKNGETDSQTNSQQVQISTLRQFYAAYILYQDNNKKMQSLDSAFLYVLATIPLMSDSDSKYTFAVFSQKENELMLAAKYPKDSHLNKSCIFLYHDDDSVHYQAIDTTDENSWKQIEKLIRNNQEDMESTEVHNAVFDTSNILK